MSPRIDGRVRAYMPRQVLVVGDHWAAQPRDVAGLAGRLHEEIRAAGTNDVAVLDGSCTGGIRDVYRALPARLAEMRSLCWESGPPYEHLRPLVLLAVGAWDARGGGPPPGAFVAVLDALREVVQHSGADYLLVSCPPAPAQLRSTMRGFAKGARRWRRKVIDDLQQYERLREHVFVPEVRDEQWADAVSLRPGGVRDLARDLAPVCLRWLAGPW